MAISKIRPQTHLKQLHLLYTFFPAYSMLFNNLYDFNFLCIQVAKINGRFIFSTWIAFFASHFYDKY